MVSLILHACVLCVAGIQHSCTDEGNSMITLCAGCEMKYETNTNTLTAQRMIENIARAISSLHSNRGGGLAGSGPGRILKKIPRSYFQILGRGRFLFENLSLVVFTGLLGVPGHPSSSGATDPILPTQRIPRWGDPIVSTQRIPRGRDRIFSTQRII